MKKKVWIMNHYATNSYFNEGGRHYWFAENLMKHGYEPTIFCANTRHNSDEIVNLKNLTYITDVKNNIPFVFVKTTPYSGNGIDRIKNMFSFYNNLFSVSKVYAEECGKPDVILASSVHPLTLVAGIKIAKKFGIPCICEVRDLWPENIFAFNKSKEKSLLGRILVAGEYWIYKNANALIFTKEGDTDYILHKKWDILQGGKINLDKCHYINNGLDIEGFEKAVYERTIVDDDLNNDLFNVVYVGSIRPVNNVGNILDAASILKNVEDIQFLIYGDGIEREMLEERISLEKIKNVKIKGYVNKQFIPYILSKSSVNILNYSNTQYNWTRGNSSNKLFEYMASGKPIISTVKMGYSIIDKYNCGIELENSTPEEFANAILQIRNMSKSQYNILSKNARDGAEDFDFKKLTKKLINVIENVNLRK